MHRLHALGRTVVEVRSTMRPKALARVGLVIALAAVLFACVAALASAGPP